MSFRDEWNKIKSDVADKENRVNLAGLAPEYDKNGKAIALPPPGSGSIVMTPALLRKKANEADVIRANFKKADDSALLEIKKTSSGLKGFTAQRGMDKFQERWKAQVDYLARLIDGGVSKGLRAAAAEMDLEDKRQANIFEKKTN